MIQVTPLIQVAPLIGVVIFSTWVYGAVELWAQMVLQLTIILLTATCLFISIRNERLEIIKTPVDLPILIFITIIGVSYGVSVYPYVSRIQVFKVIIYTFLFFIVIHTINTRERLVCLVTGIVLFGVIYAVAGMIVGKNNLFGMKLFSSGRYNISFTFPNHSHFAGFLELMVWLSLALGFVHRGAKRTLFVCFTIYMATAIAFSLSRGGFLGFLGGLCFFSITSLISRKTQKHIQIIGVFFVTLIAVGCWLGAEPFIRRIETLADPLSADRTRILVWQKTIEMIKDHPIIGTGIGTFPFVFPKYQPNSLSQVYVNHAHNDYLELASETGIVGFLSILITMALLFYGVLKKIIHSRSRTYQAIGIGSLSGCFSLLVHSFGDFNFHIPSNAILFVVCAGIAIACARLANPETLEFRFTFELCSHKKWATYAIIGVVCMGCLIVSVRPVIANAYINHAEILKQEKKYAQAIDSIHTASKIDSGNASHAMMLGDMCVNLYKEIDSKKEFLHQAIQHYHQATVLCPYKSIFYSKKGYALMMLYRFDEAEISFQQAIECDPSNPFVYKDLAKCYLTQKKYDAASIMFQKAILTDSRQFLSVLNELWDAEFDYEYIKKAVPEVAMFRKQLANFLFSKKYYQASAAEFEFAFSLEPTPEHAVEHIRSLIRIKEYAKAIEASRQYAMQFPNNRLMMKQQAYLYVALEDNEAAISVYKDLIRSDPNDSKCYIELANIYQKIQAIEDVFSILIKGIDQNPKDAELYLALSHQYKSFHKYEDAITILIKGLERCPGVASLYIHLADAYRKNHQPDKAIETLKKLVLVHNSNPSFIFALGDEYRRNGLLYEATEQWKRCLEIQPENKTCQQALYATYKALGVSPN